MPEGQDDSQVRIGAYIDPSGADAGAKQVVDDVDKIGASTGKAAEGGQKLVENLGSLRNAHHALAAIAEIAAGGTEEIAGLAMGVRFLGEAFESLIPGGAFLIALTTVLSLGASMVARQQEHNEKLDDGKKKTDDLKDSVDSLKRSEEEESKAADAAMQSFADKVKAEDEAYKDAGTQNKDRLDALQKEVDLRKQLVNAILDGAKALALKNNTGGAAGALAIEEQYAALKGTADSNAKFQKLNLDINDAYIQQQATGDQDRQVRGNKDDLQKQLDALTAARDRAVGNALAFHIPQDQDGGFKGAAAGAKEDVAALLKQWQEIENHITAVQQIQASPGHFTTDAEKAYLANLQKQAEEVNDQTKEALLREKLAAQADQSVAAYKDEKSGAPAIQKQIDEADKQLAGLHEDIQKQGERIHELEMELKIARQEKANAGLTDAGKDKGKEQSLSDKDFEGQNKADILAQQVIAEDKTKPAADREKATQAIADLKNAAVQRKIDEGTAVGADKPLTPGEIAELRAQMGQNTQEAKDRAGEIGKEATHTATAAEKTETEALKKRVEDLEKQIRAMTNNPEILRGAQMIAAEFDANPLQAVAQMNTELALAVKAGFAQVRKENENTRRAVDSLRNSQGASN